ncbi:MAG: [LSU ribosomal protein L11P]-lysine N-methyltransferase [Candidatus Electronema aureum]|uniref:Ribosomal protein L11 methyltransferase n=1 Tax=Candidatus Electronema aureum TaxID=2005002 RepID=A0A521G4J4_9BACT|nr:MAG: [LSU ribosomal protein L11P]-lysine N-methyltransferase [Candidatus Electronema aureum]
MTKQRSTNWLKTSLSCPETAVEAVTDLIGVLSGSAVEQTPVKDGMSQVSGFFQFETPDEQEQQRRHLEVELTELFAVYNLPTPQLVCSIIDDEDWATSWQQFFTPFAIVPNLIIKPSWESYIVQPGEQVIEIDPGMAFGTGQHASTKLALGLIQSCFQDGLPQKVLDVGTGTGILAMAATLFGAKEVTAIDNDPEAVTVAVENVTRNQLADRIAISATDLTEITGSFDLICANILHDVLVEMAPTITQRLVAKGKVVLAGILRGTQEENIIRVYGKLGLSVERVAYEDEWVGLLLTASAEA